jgi:hypothetical protein
LERRRRGIVVVTVPQRNPKLRSGAAYSKDAAPGGAWKIYDPDFYKYARPDGLSKKLCGSPRSLHLAFIPIFPARAVFRKFWFLHPKSSRNRHMVVTELKLCDELPRVMLSQ